MFILNSTDWVHFNIIDMFNNNNISGKISHHSADDYGALYIEQVNNIDCPQLILSTPKMFYPFDKNNTWNFPKAKVIEGYTKYDGTNIFQYKYCDSKGNEFISYKTRLVPCIRNSRFGAFYDMWEEMLDKYSNISKLPHWLNSNISYELYGLRNPHLIKYNVNLDVVILFGRSNNRIIPPSLFKNSYGVPVANINRTIIKDYIYNYQEVQKELQGRLKEENEYLTGDEGEVWYLNTIYDNWLQVKCKPEQIENIHWSQGGINNNTIKTTCINAFENWNDPSIDQIKTLLLEEFNLAEIEKVHYSIDKILKETKQHNIFKEQVLQDYKRIGLSILNNKKEVMNILSKKYAKDNMKKVYSVIIISEVK